MFAAHVDAASPPASGFTPADLAALDDIRTDALTQQRWSRTQIVHAPFADYLAAWDMHAGQSAAPNLAVARFKRTGTYVLTIDSAVIGTAASLNKILPTIRRILAGGMQEAVTAS